MKPTKTGVLLVNLGTPANPDEKSVRQFLKTFLSDRRVVDLPRLLWLPILYGVILPFRPKRVAANYRKVWMANGSPLMVYSQAQCLELQRQLEQSVSNATFRVELGMTYGEPSIATGLSQLAEWGAERVVVLPLYPQFSFTTTASVTDQLERVASSHSFELLVINDYHDFPAYIAALASSVSGSKIEFDKLVMSFHGIPRRYVTNGDPYQQQCEKTAELLAEALGLSSQQWEIAYQSRVGKEEWLMPYFDQRMTQLPQQGVKKVAVISPGFAADCLETLEEIAIQNRDLFLQNGGEVFHYVPALNESADHIQALAALIHQRLDK